MGSRTPWTQRQNRKGRITAFGNHLITVHGWLRDELAPALEHLERDHHVVADILRRLESLVGGLGDDENVEPPEPHLLRGEVEGLAALLENHFAYEERKLVAALNSLS